MARLMMPPKLRRRWNARRKAEAKVGHTFPSLSLHLCSNGRQYAGKSVSRRVFHMFRLLSPPHSVREREGGSGDTIWDPISGCPPPLPPPLSLSLSYHRFHICCHSRRSGILLRRNEKHNGLRERERERERERGRERERESRQYFSAFFSQICRTDRRGQTRTAHLL